MRDLFEHLLHETDDHARVRLWYRGTEQAGALGQRGAGLLHLSVAEVRLAQGTLQFRDRPDAARVGPVEVQRALQLGNGVLVAPAFQQLSSGDRRVMTLFVRTRARVPPVQRQRHRVLRNRVGMHALDGRGNLLVQGRSHDGIDRRDESLANLVVCKPI